MAMERLEAKKVNGHTYYYFSTWGWVDGKCRRIRQKYLGKLSDIAKAVEGGGPAPTHALAFQWGLPLAMWRECDRADVIAKTDALCPKRAQGLSVGEHLAIAALNRSICPKSKRSMWDWFCQTALLRHFSKASKATMSSQRFWDHMDRISSDKVMPIWKSILRDVIAREGIDLSSICYDGTNFYTFIDTFNARCDIAKRGKNKQGRCNLRQVSFALFCSVDENVPLYFDVYEGNRHDAKQFPIVLKGFHDFLTELSPDNELLPHITVVFDKGNNSRDNFELIDSMELNYVGSMKLNEHKDLAQVLNSDSRFVACDSDKLGSTKSFRIKKRVHGKERTLVVTYNQNLFNAQWLTVQNDIHVATDKLAALSARLADRANGIIKGGKAPTQESVNAKCKKILSRQHMKRVINYTVTVGSERVPKLNYAIDSAELAQLSETYLGKNILVTSRHAWNDAKIITAYRSQSVIENVFKEMKNRSTGSWWPLHHWTDSKIRVHALYCTIAVLLRSLSLRRVRREGIGISLDRHLAELAGIREIINVRPRRSRQKHDRAQSVLTQMSALQKRLVSVLEIQGHDTG